MICSSLVKTLMLPTVLTNWNLNCGIHSQCYLYIDDVWETDLQCMTQSWILTPVKIPRPSESKGLFSPFTLMEEAALGTHPFAQNCMVSPIHWSGLARRACKKTGWSEQVKTNLVTYKNGPCAYSHNTAMESHPHQPQYNYSLFFCLVNRQELFP